MRRLFWRKGHERLVYPLGPRFVVKIPRRFKRQYHETNLCEMLFWQRVRGTPDRMYFAECFVVLPLGLLIQERVAWTYDEKGEELPQVILDVRERWSVVELAARNVGMGYDGVPKWIDYQDGTPWAEQKENKKGS